MIVQYLLLPMYEKIRNLREYSTYFYLLFGIVFGSGIIFIIFRFQRGLYALILSALAIALLIYWIYQLNKMIKKGNLNVKPFIPMKSWNYDIIEGENGTVQLLAEVPGLCDEIKFDFSNNTHVIHGPRKFLKYITMPQKLELLDDNCINGVLKINFKKIT